MDQPLTGAQFGESKEYGERLNYTKPVYRDILFGIAYYVHLLAVIGAGAYLWISEYPNVQDSNNDDWQSDVSLTGIFVGVACCAVAGVVFGLLWLQIMKRFASTIIKMMLFVNIGCWLLVGIVGIFVTLALAVVGFIMAAISALYAWCIWRRIPFASALLSVSSSITSQYGGTVFISLLVIVFNIIYLFIWASCASAYYMVSGDNQSGFIIFLLFVAFYWAFQVHQNISHTTTCGVTAAWYFSTELNYNPTPPALKRTMTTSFGSVCFGSLLVAIIQALEAMIRSAQNNKNQLISCIALCLLNCIEALIRWFNKYAYAHCAIYGHSFIQSARDTMKLFSTRGMMALINDDLTGLPITLGALIGGIISAGVGYLVGFAFYGGSAEHDIRVGIPAALAVYGFLVGLILCATVLYVVHSSIICLFVCYCEEPAVLYQNRREEYNRITNAKPAWGDIYNQFGQGSEPMAMEADQ